MAWLSQDWQYRYPFVIPIDAAFVQAAGNQPWAIHIPSSWAYFWENIQPGGADVRITDWTGKNVIDYTFPGGSLSPGDYISVNFANVTNVNQFDDEPAINTSPDLMVCWLYWGNVGATDAQGQAGGGFVKAIDVSTPAPFFDYTVQCLDIAPGTTAVTQTITKPPNNLVQAAGYASAANVYWDVTNVIGSAFWGDVNNRLLVDQEIMKFCAWVVDSTAPFVPVQMGVWSDATMVMDSAGSVFLKIPYSGGTSGDLYHLDLQMQTRRTLNDFTDHREPRARVNLEVIEPT